MRPTPARSARVTRITPPEAILTRAGGRAVLLGATVTDGEALTLATPTGDGGAVTLDRRGVALRLTTVRLVVPAMVAEAPSATPEAPPVVAPVVIEERVQ